MPDPSASETPVPHALAAITIASLEWCDLPGRDLMIARIAALAAVGAPPVSYSLSVEAAASAGLTVKDVQDILVGVAPIIGTARTAEAAAHITEGLGMAIALAEADSEAES